MRLKPYIIVLLCLMLVACNREKLKDDNTEVSNAEGKQNIEEAYEKINSKGRNPFTTIDYDGSLLPHLPEESIVTLSPDKSILFVQSRIANKEADNIIMGPTYEKVNLIKINLSNGQKQVVAKNIAFINNVKWNRSGNCVGFVGGEKLILYDLSKNRLLFEKELKNDPVTYFGWSPDGKIIYTEHPNLANGSKLYFDDEKIQMAYETHDNLYYKGILDDNFYYATLKNEDYYNQKGTQAIEEYTTVIVDSQGNIVQELPGGRHRDAYGLSLLQTDKNGFGLYFFPDINNPDNIKEMTNEFVYDAKFIYNGGIAYILRDKSLEKNVFEMHIADKSGNETAVYEVSGNSFLLLPDGKTGYSSGLKQEEIHFDNNTITALQIKENINKEREEVFTAIRGAMDIYYKLDLTGERDYEGAKKYFIDSSEPEQWAYFDVITSMNEKKDGEFMTASAYELAVSLKDIKVANDKSGVKRASVGISVNGENSSGSGFGADHSLELIEKDEGWYVTGFSTYPNSKQTEVLKKKVQQCIKDAQAGKLFDGELKGKEVKIGQIQFWQMSSPHLADDISYANYCKVYLKVIENNKENIYKMVLSNKNQKEWKPESLSKDRLHWLF